MRYILAYFALMLGLSGLSLIGAGRGEGLLVLVIAAVPVYILVRMEQSRRRQLQYGGYDIAIDGYEKHFSEAERELEARLPDDALESPAMLELLSAAGKDADDAEAVRTQYAQLQCRFHDWRAEFERLHEQNETGSFGLPQAFADRYADLDRGLTQLLEDVGRLDARAEQVRSQTDDPLDKIAEGALKLEQATAKCTLRFGNNVPEALQSKLSLAASKLADARAAIAAGAERPLDAVRLSEEVCALARSVDAAAG
jgi:hypothetical protein